MVGGEFTALGLYGVKCVQHSVNGDDVRAFWMWKAKESKGGWIEVAKRTTEKPVADGDKDRETRLCMDCT